MGSDEVYYVQNRLHITIDDINSMEPDLFYWILESLLVQEAEEM
jgi:hypothetical protein